MDDTENLDVVEQVTVEESTLPEWKTLRSEGVCPIDGMSAFRVVGRHTDPDTGNELIDCECDLGHTWTGVSRLQQILMMGYGKSWREHYTKHLIDPPGF